ncbi:pilus assembly protein PilN [Burkholderia plantarii]|uniref:pilus assembly protein PilN n=1 Tax=Burkholderia plantarii TaxID=41899 RepID=UPI0018DBD7DE|nr:pilus assembly protein PilN [Burkholderia plantarii]MBI0326563.1 pilus assembly protein PilN [Burkholderia plantarii]
MSARRRLAAVPPRAAMRDPARRRAWLGGFNLMPYRQRDARLRRRRRAAELAGAACVGMAAAALSCAAQALERARLDTRRAAIEQQLVQWAPRVRALDAAAREAAARRRHETAAAERARPLARAMALFDALRALDYRSVVLLGLRQADGTAQLDARARDPLAAARWVARLRETRADWRVEVAGIDAGRGEPAAGRAGSIRFVVRIRWPQDDPRPRAAVSHSGATGGGRG